MDNHKRSPLVEFVQGEPCIEVFAAEKSQTSASRYLYGKFSEHLWSNVYNGMWAQILHNTGFEPGKYFSHGDEDDRERRLGWTEYATGLKGLVESYKDGVAFGWAKYGDGDATYSLDTDRVNSDTSQKVVVRSLKSPEVGVQQPIYLPLHRTNKYELSVWVKGSAKNLYIAIRTIDGRQLGKAEITGVTPEWKKHTARLDIDRQGIERGQALVLTLGIREPGTLWLDQCFLFPTDHRSGFDPDIIRMLRDSKLPLLRFPGGNFASGYHWQDGIGPIDRRPIRMNPAWSHDEPNHVGTDDWLKFCELVGCEPLICVNAGNGTPEEAAAWVEYCNGSKDTKYGALRAENGHPKPYNVKLWEIGNELYGSWQIGHCTPEEYAERYERFYKAMSAVDPTIKFIANGQYPEWNAPIIERNAKILRSLSIHCLMGEPIPAEADPEAVFRSYMALPVWFEGYLRSLGKQMADGGVADPHIALTELQMFTKKRELPTNQTMTEALFYAGMVNTGIRLDGLLELITHSALVNHGAGLRKDHEIVFANPVHWAHNLYSTQPGERPVRVRISSPQFSVERLHDLPAVENVSYLDAVALLDKSGDHLVLLVTNRHPTDALTAEIALNDFAHNSEVSVQTLAGHYMGRNSWEKPNEVAAKKSTARTGAKCLTYAFPAASLTCLTFHPAT